MKDCCDRNGEPYPVKRIPDEIIELFEEGDTTEIHKLRSKYHKFGL